MKKIAILGSTGSVGSQTLQVVRAFPKKLKVVSLVAYSDEELLQKQSREFSPDFSALICKSGKQCLIDAVKKCDIAVVATRGIVALEAVLFCLQHGITVALANKETLVCGGELVMRIARENNAKILPVDSEHCAIWQCLRGNKSKNIEKILLTASGGPFWNTPREQLHLVSANEALKHPNWNMGQKITVDSATMMNKVLEVAEAHFLFDVPPQNVQIVVHRQSVVHSMVQFKSGSIIAQMAMPDMRLPIQLALLGDSNRIVQCVDFQNLTLTFEQCDFQKFPCAKLAEEIWNYPPLCRTVMNGANDVCVEAFLAGKLAFDEFYPTICAALKQFAPQVEKLSVSVENIEKYNDLSRRFAKSLLNAQTDTVL